MLIVNFSSLNNLYQNLSGLEIDFSKVDVVTSDEDTYKEAATFKKRFFISANDTLNKVPNKSYRNVYIPRESYEVYMHYGYVASNLANSSYEYAFSRIDGAIPVAFKTFFNKVEETVFAQKEYFKKKEMNNKLLEEYEEKVSEWRKIKSQMKERYESIHDKWKEMKKEIKEDNKKALAEWKEAYDNAEENLKKFIMKPEPMEIPEEPTKPVYPNKPEEPNYIKDLKKPSLNSFDYSHTVAWRILKVFKIYVTENKEFMLLKRREEPLTNNSELIVKTHLNEDFIGNISFEEFNKIISETNGHKNIKAEAYIQKADSTNVVDFLSELDDSHLDMVFEEEKYAIKPLPPLTKVKPMHAASMLSDGIGDMYQELMIDGYLTSVKSSRIKTVKESDVIENGIRKKISIESDANIIGTYNQDLLVFELLNGA